MGTRERRERELEDRKKLILEKSKELFFEKGFEQVTIQDICDSVEYGRSAIYSIFESKEEMYSHIYLDAMNILIDLNESIDPETDDFDSEFIKSIENIFEFYNSYTNYYKALSFFNTNAMAHSKIPPKILEVKEKLAERAVLKVALLMQKAVLNDYIKDINLEEFILLNFSALTGIINMFIQKDEEEDKEEIRRSCIMHGQLYLAGLKK
ncbi:MAG: TetR/AcrR family transcriptional regulator [bacterium]|nr:TetR/AcrR family transcriptional regulator [bacterium]